MNKQEFIELVNELPDNADYNRLAEEVQGESRRLNSARSGRFEFWFQRWLEGRRSAQVEID